MFLISEIIEIIITIVIAGYILMPLTRNNLKKSFILAGLSIVLHELGHKFVGMLAGFNAIYHANYQGLILGLILRFFNAPVFFVPAYVSIYGATYGMGYLMTALAGPLVNLAIFLIAKGTLQFLSHKEFVQDNAQFINSLMVINMWLAIINMLPIPGTDGYNALMSLKYL